MVKFNPLQKNTEVKPVDYTKRFLEHLAAMHKDISTRISGHIDAYNNRKTIHKHLMEGGN